MSVASFLVTDSVDATDPGSDSAVLRLARPLRSRSAVCLAVHLPIQGGSKAASKQSQMPISQLCLGTIRILCIGKAMIFLQHVIIYQSISEPSKLADSELNSEIREFLTFITLSLVV